MIGSKTASWKPPKAERYIVFVDRQAKSNFASEHAAHAEAQRISGAFPNVVVAVRDTEQDTVKLLRPVASITEQELAATRQTAHGDTNDR